MQRRSRSRRRRIVGLTVLAVVAVVGVAGAAHLAPTAIGGNATYAVVADRSMEPALHPGDLAVLERRDVYGVGDIVAVRGSDGLVPRRVIAVSDGRLILKADAAEMADRRGVLPVAVAGALTVTVPAAGHALEPLRERETLALIGLALGLSSLVMLVVAWPSRARSTPRRPPDSLAAPPVVPVVGALDVDAPVVEVASLASLVELARHAGAVILEERVDGAVRYLAEMGGTVDRFTVPAARGLSRDAAVGTSLTDPVHPGLVFPDPHGLLSRPGR